jgi:hypothetical protein
MGGPSTHRRKSLTPRLGAVRVSGWWVSKVVHGWLKPNAKQRGSGVRLDRRLHSKAVVDTWIKLLQTLEQLVRDDKTGT